MDKIRNNIYIGNSNDAQHNKNALNEAGITAILNVALDLTNKTTTHKDFKMYHVGLIDGGGNHPNIFIAAVETLNGLLNNREVVLIHCHSGVSRSPLVLATYLTEWTREFKLLDDAEAYLKSLRPRVDINRELKQLYTNTKLIGLFG